MAQRPKIPAAVEQAVLVNSGRRCCLCYGLAGDAAEKKGQIAHLDGDRTNNRPDNLAFLCFDHHDGYDSTTSQSKNYTENEAKHYRAKLYAKVAGGLHLTPPTPQGAGGLEVVDLDFMESRIERLKCEDHSCYSVLKDMPKYADFLDGWAADPSPKAGEMPVLDVKLRNTSTEVVFLKRAVFHVIRVWPLAPFALCFSEVNVSANYQVWFPNRPPPFTVEVPLAQCVPPNGVDRFTLTLRPDAFAHVMLAAVDLVYNADGRVVRAGDILFALRDHDHKFWRLPAERVAQEPDEQLREKYVLNNTAAEELKAIRAVRSSVVRAFEAGEL